MVHSKFKLNRSNLNYSAAKATFRTACGCSEKRCSDFDGSGTGVLENIYCEANLVSDKKVDFSPKTPTAAIPLFNPDQPQV